MTLAEANPSQPSTVSALDELVLSQSFEEEAPRGKRWGKWVALVVLVLAVGGAVAFAATLLPGWRGARDEGLGLTHEVKRGDLLITVTEDGNVESASNVDVKCEVAGGSKILWITPDGTQARQGDELVRLDSSTIEDQANAQKIVFEKAQAAKIQSEKEHSAARIAVQEYEEGTYLKEMQTLEANIKVAMENLRSAENMLGYTERMARKGYVTSLQLDSQVFAVARAKLDLASAETAKNVLGKFTKPKMMEDLTAKRDSAEAKMRSDKTAFELEEARLKRLNAQLASCLIKAPRDGMVVYANETGHSRMGQQSVTIEEGAAVRERQSIIRLPDLTQMQVKVTVHESKVESLKPGMRARIRIQDRDYGGQVYSVANQPEPSSFFSAAVKEYATIVKIDGTDPGLRPGMTASVEILVAHLKDVITLPLQAIVDQGGKLYCWVATPTGPERRPIVLGSNSKQAAEIREGLSQGEEVLLNPRAVVAESREDVQTLEPVEKVAKSFGTTLPMKPGSANGPPKGLPGEKGSPGDKGPDGKKSGKRGGGRGGPGDIMQFDKDKDGKVSKEEAPERMRDFFDMIDTNKDGFITAAEAAEARRQMEQKMKAAGAMPDGPGGPPGGPRPGN